MKATVASIYNLLRRLLVIVILFVMTMSKPANAQSFDIAITVQNTMNPMPPQGLLYVDRPGQFFNVIIMNMNSTAVSGRIELDLYYMQDGVTPSGQLGVHGKLNSVYAYPTLTVQPNGNVVLSGEGFNQFFRYSAEDVYSSGTLGNARNSLSKKNSYYLEEGRYCLKVQLVDASNKVLGEGTCYFDICYKAQGPKIVSPSNMFDLRDTLVSKNIVTDNINAFTFPQSPIFRWNAPTFNKAQYNGKQQFIYDFELIRFPEGGILNTAENAIQKGTVAYKRQNLLTEFCTIPSFEAKMLSEAKDKDVYYVARVKARPIDRGDNITYAVVQNEGYGEYCVVAVPKKSTDNGLDKDIKMTLEQVRKPLPTLVSEFYNNPGSFYKLTIENSKTDSLEVVLLQSLKSGDSWTVMPSYDSQVSKHAAKKFTIPGTSDSTSKGKTVLTGSRLSNLIGGYLIKNLSNYDSSTDVLTGVAEGKFPEDENKVIIQLFKHSSDSIAIYKEEQLAEAECKISADEDEDEGEIKMEVESIVSTLPSNIALYYANPGNYFRIKIKSDKHKDVEASLLHVLKSGDDWAVMPLPNYQHSDRTFTIKGIEQGLLKEDPEETTLEGSELTYLLGGYALADLSQFDEKSEYYIGSAPSEFPKGDDEKKVVFQLFEHADDKAISDMDPLGEEELEIKKVMGGASLQSVTVSIEPKSGVVMPNDAFSYFKDPDKYFNFKISNSGKQDVSVAVKLSLDNYRDSREIKELTPISIPAETTEEVKLTNICGHTSNSNIKRYYFANDTVKKDVLGADEPKFKDGITHMMTIEAYDFNETITATSTSSTQSNGSGSTSSSAGSSSGTSTTAQTGTTATVSSHIFFDSDSCLVVPTYLEADTLKAIKISVEKKDAAIFNNKVIKYVEKPSDFFTVKVKNSNKIDLKKCALQVRMPHPTDKNLYLTTLVTNISVKDFPKGDTEIALSEDILNKICGNHTVSELRECKKDSHDYERTKVTELKAGENEFTFVLCSVDSCGSIVTYGKSTCKITIEEPKKADATVKIAAKDNAGVAYTDSINNYFVSPEKYFDFSICQNTSDTIDVRLVMIIDDKWISVDPLCRNKKISLTGGVDKTLSEQEIKDYLGECPTDKNAYTFDDTRMKSWKTSAFDKSLLSLGVHKIKVALYKEDSSNPWNSSSSKACEDLRKRIISSDSCNILLKRANTIDIVVKYKSEANLSLDLEELLKKPSDAIELTIKNKDASAQTIRIGMVVDNKYTSVSSLVAADALKLEGKPADGAKHNNDSITLSEEQIDRLLASKSSDDYRVITSEDDGNGNIILKKWQGEDDKEPFSSISLSKGNHNISIYAYLDTKDNTQAKYSPDENGLTSFKDYIGNGKCVIETTGEITNKSCGTDYTKFMSDDDKKPGNFPTSIFNPTDSTTTAAPGFDVQVGAFTLHITKWTQDNTEKWLKGSGYVTWKFGTSGPGSQKEELMIACEFEKLYVNSNKVCYAGEVTSTKLKNSKYKDAIPYSWFEESSLAGSRDEYIKRMKAAQGADNKFADYYEYTKSSLIPMLRAKGASQYQGDLITLPAAVPPEMWCESKLGTAAALLAPVDVQLLNMSFGPDHAWMNLTGILTLPEINTTDSKNIIMFGGPHICVDQDADYFLPGDGALAMMTDYEVKLPTTDVTLSLLAPADWSDVMGGCYYAWKDHKFDVVTVKGGVTIPHLMAVDDKYEQTGENARAEVAFTFRDKQNFGIGVSLDAFQIDELEGYTFTPTGGEVGVYIDMSSKETPKGVYFPAKYDFNKTGFGPNATSTDKNVITANQASRENTGPWQGVYIQQVECRFPDWLSSDDEEQHLAIGVKNLMVDKSGFTVNAYAASDYELSNDDGWKISLDSISLCITQTKFDDFYLLGDFGLPIIEDPFKFRAGITTVTDVTSNKKGYEIEFKVSLEDNAKVDIKVADIELMKNQTYIGLTYNSIVKKKQAEFIAAGKISLKSPKDGMSLDMKGIQFTGFRIANFDKDLSKRYKSMTSEGVEEEKNDNSAAMGSKKKKLKNIYFEMGRWSLASPQHHFGPFAIALKNYTIKTQDMADGNIRLGFNFGASLSICDVFSAGGSATTWGIIDKNTHKLKHETVEFEEATISAGKVGTFQIEGTLKSSKDEEFGYGYAGTLKLSVPVFSASVEGGYFTKEKSEAELQLDYDRLILEPDTTYAWGYFSIDVEVPECPLPVSFKGVRGGLYFNCNVEKIPSYRTLGMKVGATVTVAEVAEVDAQVTMAYDMANRRCSNLVIDGDISAKGGLVKTKVTLVYANPSETEEYVDLLVTVDAESPNAVADKLFGIDVSTLTDTLNKGNEALSNQKESSGASTANMKNAAKTQSDVWKSLTGKDAKLQEGKAGLSESLGAKEDRYKEGARRSDDTSTSSSQLPGVKATIPINFHYDLITDKCHLYVGEPDFSKRVSVTFIDYAAGGDKIGMSAKVFMNAYLCCGNELPDNGVLPQIPTDINSFLFSDNKKGTTISGPKAIEADPSIAANHEKTLERYDVSRRFTTQGGVMVGGEVGGDFKVNGGVFYVDASIHGGFDLIMQKLGEGASCANLDGMAGTDCGFYATGQFYALIKGDVGAIVNLGFFKGKVPLMSAAFGGLIQGGAPNPSWYYGSVRSYVTLLGGAFKFNFTTSFKGGEVCIPDQGNPLDEYTIIDESSITPGYKSHETGWNDKNSVSPYSVPSFSTTVMMGKSIMLIDKNTRLLVAGEDEDNVENYDANSIREYRFVFGKNTYDKYNLSIAQYDDSITNATHRAVNVKTNDNINYTVDYGEPFQPNQKYCLHLMAYVEEFRDRAGTRSWGKPVFKDTNSGNKEEERDWSQVIDYYFCTGSRPDNLDPMDIAVARPGNDSTHYSNNILYRNEARCPYLSLTNDERWNEITKNGQESLYGYLYKVEGDTPKYLDKELIELACVEEDIYLVRPNKNFNYNSWSTQDTYRYEILRENDSTLVYNCDFTVNRYESFKDEMADLVKSNQLINKFPSLGQKGLGTLLNISQKWNRSSKNVDTMNDDISDESVYHDSGYGHSSSGYPTHYMLSNPYYFMAYWANFGLIGSQKVNSKHPYFPELINNTDIAITLASEKYRNGSSLTGHLQSLTNMGGTYTASEARDLLKPAMYYRDNGGTQWGYESGSPWPAIHDTIAAIVRNDAIFAEQILETVRPRMTNYVNSSVSPNYSDDFKKDGKAIAKDFYYGEQGGGCIEYRMYQSILPFAIDTQNGLSFETTRLLGYGFGRSDDGQLTSWSRFPLLAATNNKKYGKTMTNGDCFSFVANNYLQSLDAYQYRLYRVNGYHTTRGHSGYTVLESTLATNAYDVNIDAKSGSTSGTSASREYSEKEYIYISDLVVSTNSDSKQAQQTLIEQGYSVLPYDLNQGAGGKSDYVYLGYKESTHKERAITHALIYSVNDGSTVLNSIKYEGRTYQRASYFGDTNGDINSKAGSLRQYLYITRETLANDSVITSVNIINNGKNKITGERRDLAYRYDLTSKKAQYNANLNEKTNGSYIYLQISYAQRPVNKIESQTSLTFIKDIMVVSSSSESVAKKLLTTTGTTDKGIKESYNLIGLDMNAGTNGKKIFVGYTTTSNSYEAITDVFLYSTSSAKTNPTITINGRKYTLASALGGNGDLNEGAGGRYLYLYCTRDGNLKSGSAVTSIDAASINKGVYNHTRISRWDGANMSNSSNVNEGAKNGQAISIYIKKEDYYSDGKTPDSYNAAIQYPSILAVAGDKDAATAQLKLLENGYTLLTTDLNGDGKGSRIFMGYKSTTKPADAIKEVLIRNGKEKSTSGEFYRQGRKYIKSVTLLDAGNCGDLNAGTGGDCLYLYYTIDKFTSGNYITDLTVDVYSNARTNSNYAYLIDGESSSANADLDKKAKSNSYIYLNQKKGTDKSAAMPELYLGDVKLYAGKDKTAIKKQIYEDGYIAWDVELNSGQNKNYYTYLAYKGTDKPLEGVTGMMIYRSSEDLSELSFKYNGKVYERVSSKGCIENGNLKVGMKCGSYFYICSTKDDEPDGTRIVLTNKSAVKTTKDTGKDMGGYDPDSGGAAQDFSLRCGGKGSDSWVYLYGKEVSEKGVHHSIEGSYLTDVMIAASNNVSDAKKIIKDAKFSTYDVNLNNGVGGIPVYLGYKSSSSIPAEVITEIAVLESTTEWRSSVTMIDGKTWYRAKSVGPNGNYFGNMNAAAGQKYVYLVYRKAASSEVSDAVIAPQENSYGKNASNWKYTRRITVSGKNAPNGDYNAGFKGKSLYIEMPTRNYDSKQAPAKNNTVTPTQYISDVAISTNKSVSAAKKWLTDRGYKVWDCDLSAGDTHVYAGYKTSTSPNNAVTGLMVARTKTKRSEVTFVKDNQIYYRCADSGTNYGDLRPDCGSGYCYYLCQTKTSTGSTPALTTESMFIDKGSTTMTDNNLAHGVDLDASLKDMANMTLRNGNNKGGNIYLYLKKGGKAQKNHGGIKASSGVEYITKLYTSSASKKKDAFEHKNFKGHKRIEVDLNRNSGGNRIYLGYDTSKSPKEYIDDIVIYKGSKKDKDKTEFTLGGKTWKKATCVKGTSDVNEGRSSAPYEFILYHVTSKPENALIYDNGYGLQVISVDKGKSNGVYSRHYVDMIDSSGTRTRQGNANLGTLIGNYNYIYAQYIGK